MVVTNPNATNNTDKPNETKITSLFAQEFDEDYTKYFEERKATPEKDKEKRKFEANGESSTDSENV